MVKKVHDAFVNQARTAKKLLHEQSARFQERQKEIQTEIQQTFARHKLFIALLSVVFILLAYSFFSGGIIRQILGTDVRTLTSFVANFGPAASIIYVLLTSLEVVIAPIPSVVLYAAGGILFGTVYGTILTLIGNLIGSTAAYFLAKYFLRTYIESRIPQNLLDKFNAAAEKYGPYALFFLRLNPFTSSDIFSYLSGITRMRYPAFIVSTALGLAPLIFFQAYLGSSIIGQNQILSLLLVVFSCLYVIGFIYVLVKPINAKSKEK